MGYLVILNARDINTIPNGESDHHVFGPFDTHTLALEWVDENLLPYVSPSNEPTPFGPLYEITITLPTAPNRHNVEISLWGAYHTPDAQEVLSEYRDMTDEQRANARTWALSDTLKQFANKG